MSDIPKSDLRGKLKEAVEDLYDWSNRHKEIARIEPECARQIEGVARHLGRKLEDHGQADSGIQKKNSVQ